MGIEINNNSEDISRVIKDLFNVESIPEYTSELISKMGKLSKETVLQLMLYWNHDDWSWYGNLDKFCDNEEINSLIEAIYIYVNNPAYILGDDDLTEDLRILYEHIKNRLSMENWTTGQVQETKQKIINILR